MLFHHPRRRRRKALSLQLDTRFPGGRRARPVFLKSWMSISCPLAKRLLPTGKPYLFTSGAGPVFASKVGSFLASAEVLGSDVS